MKESILCVGNFDSGTGYAWRLIEKLWTIVADVGNEKDLITIACYPSITEINPELVKAGISVDKYHIATRGIKACGCSFSYLKKNGVKYLYLTDRPVFSWCYLAYRLAGVKKIIVHDHTPGYRSPVVGLKKAIKSIINRLLWITADLAIGVSPYVSERLKVVNCLPQRKIQCVTNGIKDRATAYKSL